MSRRARLVAVGWSIAAGAPACLLSIDPLPVLGGADGGVPSPEAGGDQSTAPLPDGGADGDAGADAGGASPCRTTHLLCADFDGPDAAGVFDYFEQTDGGVSLVVDTTSSKSPPSSAHGVLAPIAAGSGSRYARFGAGQRLPHLTKSLRYAFDLRVAAADTAPGDATLEVTAIYLNHGGTSYELAVALNGLAVRMTEFVDPSSYEAHAGSVAALKLGEWAHVEIDVTLGAAPSVAFTVDGKLVLPNAALKFPLDASDITVSLGVGLDFIEPPTTQTIDLAVDNVVVDGS